MKNQRQNKSAIKKSSQAGLKFLAVIILFLTTLLSTGYAYANAYGGFQVRQERLNINGVLVSRPSPEDVEIAKLLMDNDIHTPEQYSQWLAKNIEYKKDKGSDVWANPLTVIARKFGDCEDFTFLNIAVLRVMGYDAQFVAFFAPETQGHAVCVFKYNGSNFYFDNKDLKEMEENNVMKFVKNMVSTNNYNVSRELDLDSRKWKLLYKTS